MTEPILINQLSFLRRFGNDYSRLGDDYACVHVHTDNGCDGVRPSSLRFDGVMLMLVRKGDVELTINMESYHLPSCTLLVVPPQTTVSVHSVNTDEIDIYLMQISIGFLHDINFEVNMLNIVPLTVEHRPSMTLLPEECELLAKYLDLIHSNTLANNSSGTEMYARCISRNLMAAMLYQSMAMGQRHRTDSPSDSERSRSRKVIYTGRSAATWIDDYVLTEAKHLLRFSGKNIQQVAYELNFTNQSSFGKYFKHLTGMSPSEYQHS